MSDPSSSISVTNLSTLSLPTRLSHRVLHLIAPKLRPSPNQTPAPPGSPRFTIPHSPYRSRHCYINERSVSDIWVYDLQSLSHPSFSPSSPSSDTTNDVQQPPPSTNDTSESRRGWRRIYCIAGGSFSQPPTGQHWSLYTHLCNSIPRCTVSVLSVPLAPHSPAPETFPKMVTVLTELLRASEREGEIVSLMGDSSGGNMILSLAVEIMSRPVWERKFAPKSLMLVCPSTDLRHQSEEEEKMEREGKDPLLVIREEKRTAAQWAGDWGAEDVRVSPLLRGDGLKILKEMGTRVHGVTAGHDILTPDALKLRAKLEELGVEGKWLHWERQMHGFPLAFPYKLKESVEGVKWITEVLKDECESGVDT